MLHKNPITKSMYKCGYLPNEDLYEFWIDNKHKILHYYKQTVSEKHFNIAYEEFIHKIGWSSVCGMFLRFEIKKYLRRTDEKVTNLGSVTTRYGRDIISIPEFNDMIGKRKKNMTRTDLRGASLISMDAFDITIENVCFDHCSFHGSSFSNVTFKNCSFINTEFDKCRIMDCTFEEDCIMDNVSFHKAIIKSTFNCKVTRIAITRMILPILTDKALRKLFKFPYYTIILSPSIGEQSNPSILRAYHRQKILRKAISKHPLLKKYVK